MSDTITTTQTPVGQPTPFSDPLVGGIPGSLQPDWANRRKVIFWALGFCGACTGLIIVTGCAMALLGVFFKSASDSLAVLSFLGSSLYTLAFVATTIIGSYVFGVNMDWANTRQHILNLVSTTTTGTVASNIESGNAKMQRMTRKPLPVG